MKKMVKRTAVVTLAGVMSVGMLSGCGSKTLDGTKTVATVDGTDIPLGVVTCVTGVSGSGKSSLVNEILYKHLAKSLNRARCIAGDHDGIDGIEQLDKVINIDQSPIGRTPRSNPATYTGVFDFIRELFSQTNEAKLRGYKPGRLQRLRTRRNEDIRRADSALMLKADAVKLAAAMV